MTMKKGKRKAVSVWFYNTKSRLHFSSQYIKFNAEFDGSVSEIPTRPIQDILVLFRFLAVRSPHSIVQHRLERQETP